MRSQAWEAANGTAAAGFAASVVAGFDWPAIAACLAAIYSLFLIAEKAYSWYRRFKDRPKP